MSNSELYLIKDLVSIHSDARLHPTYNQVMFILNREIKLKELDPRKEKKFKPHKNTCPAHGNYQPPYEECNCGADE